MNLEIGNRAVGQMLLAADSGWLAPYESYVARGGFVERHLTRRDGNVIKSRIKANLLPAEAQFPTADKFDLSWLRSSTKPRCDFDGSPLRIADLFCGCGGMSLGADEGLRALGYASKHVFACDIDPVALDAYSANFHPEVLLGQPIEELLNGDLGSHATETERHLRKQIGRVDLMLAGPPCQGHSDLNNHTRRQDKKNQLILRAIRFVELFKPQFVLIENVQGIRHDRMGSLDEAKRALTALGYAWSDGLVRADSIGVPQARRRYFLFATKSDVHPFPTVWRKACDARGVGWAINDLASTVSSGVFDTSAEHSAENKRRIDFLFEHDLHELPDSERPNCHRGGGHGYDSVYGRMRWNKPAPTITTGFGSMGQGRFVHPCHRRTLTPHEAARVQFIPDFFKFGDRGRRQFQSLIGNAVPPKLAYAVLLSQLR